MSTAKIIRCAIYTRKSTDEGLEQEFNTLEAQREACEAYIKSQAHEGWRAIPERFDDGGHSGGTLERPAMKRLLGLVRDRRVDIILIYKIDRLTRSLTDFAKLAEQFDQYSVSFVSVTQQFNTTTSMGRLMLNVLLSFAQFEREISGERIRDKIAASKKKGMWMGGSVPLGYDWKDRKLIINQTEAKTVRILFDLYLKLGNVRSVVAEANMRRLKTKIRVSRDSRQPGGKAFSRGHVYAILNNPLYAGRVAHQGETYAGEHAAIIPRSIWQATQSKISANSQGQRKTCVNSKDANHLVGILYDEHGNHLTPSHTTKSGRRYRYYVENALITGESQAKGSLRRIPATEIEASVTQGVAGLLTSRTKLLQVLGRGLSVAEFSEASRQAELIANRLTISTASEAFAICRPILSRVMIGTTNLIIHIESNALRTLCGATYPSAKPISTHEVSLRCRLGKHGGQQKLILQEALENGRVEPALVKALAQAHHWWELLNSASVISLRQISQKEGKANSYIGRVIRLAFLAPEIQQAILSGRQPPELTAKQLILRENLNIEWSAQERRLIKRDITL